MKKWISVLPTVLILMTFTYSLTHLQTINQMTSSTFKTAIQLFFSLYPLMVLFSLMNDLNIFIKIASCVHFIFAPLLHLNRTELAIYLASFFSGYPTFAKIIKDSYLSHKITKESASHLLRICSHGSIGFIVSTLGTILFHDIRIGWVLWLIQILANLMIAFFYRHRPIPLEQNLAIEKQSIIFLLEKELKKCAGVFIYVFGFMLVFNILGEVFFSSHPLMQGWLEFSQGCINLQNQDFPTQLFFSSIWISFSSFSVIFQVTSLLDGLDINFKPYLSGRLLQALLSGLLALLYLLFT